MAADLSYQSRTYTEDEAREHTYRLKAMIEDDGETWDLSDNDKAALEMALAAVENANLSICVYCGYVGAKNTDRMIDHTLTCEKRPEAKLFDIISELAEALRSVISYARLNAVDPRPATEEQLTRWDAAIAKAEGR